jgi:hypothetical protein
MGLRDQNPLIDQDFTNIISAYERGANAQDTEESVFAIFTPEVIETKGFSRSIIDNLNTYNTRSITATGNISEAKSDGSFQLAGLNLQNTISTIMDADSVGEALKIAAKDCVPCEDRLLALLNLNPLDDLKDLLNRDIRRRIQSLFSLVDLLNNTDVFNDLCQLLRELNFHCIPDLNRIAMLLTLLLSKYKQKLDLSINLPETLTGMFFTPFLGGMNTLLDQYKQLILAPIECVIDSLNFQIQKLDIGEGIAKAEAITSPKKVDKEDPKSTKGWIPDISKPLKKQTSERLGKVLDDITDSKAVRKLTGKKTEAEKKAEEEKRKKELEDAKSSDSKKGDALSDLAGYLKQGKSFVDGLLDFVREQLEALLNTAGINTDEKRDHALNKLNLLRLISLVVSIINATKSGSLNCGDLQSVDAAKKLETFLNGYIRPNTIIRINYDPSKGEITVQSPQINETQSNNIAEIYTNIQQDLPLTTNTAIVDGKKVERKTTIFVKNCLRDINKQDLEKVTQWISEFEGGETS